MPHMFADNTMYEEDNCCITNNNGTYIITPSEPIGTPSPGNIKNLWLVDETNKKTLLKQIQHTNDIEEIVFSKDGKYLAIKSNADENNKNAQLSLIYLGIENDTLVNPHNISLSHYPGWNSAFCFNNQSTMIVVAFDNIIVFWDLQTDKTINSKADAFAYLPSQGQNVKGLYFNYNDTRLAVESHNYVGETPKITYTISLYDTSDLSYEVLLNTVELHDSRPFCVEFNPSGDKLLIGMETHTLVLDGWSGEQLMETPKVDSADQNTVNSLTAPTLMSELNILATNTFNNINTCNTKLWDITTGNLIATLTENATNVAGVGITPNCRSVVATALDGTIIKTKLCNKSLYEASDAAVKKLNIFQLYCLHRIDKENQEPQGTVLINRQSLLYDGIKTLPQNMKNVMYNIFHILKAYGPKNRN